MAERDQLFDLAIARALSYAQTLHLDLKSESLNTDLEVWYLKTRFAYRIPLGDIIKVLHICPATSSKWEGGKNGKWVNQELRI